jgi:hypothetical protein
VCSFRGLLLEIKALTPSPTLQKISSIASLPIWGWQCYDLKSIFALKIGERFGIVYRKCCLFMKN